MSVIEHPVAERGSQPTPPGRCMRLSLCLGLSLSLCLSAQPAAAQLGTALDATPITSPEYQSRRDSVAARIGDGVLLAFGAHAPVTDEGRFRQTPNFRYLTGHLRPDAALVLVARAGEPVVEAVFEPAIDPRMYLYDGFPPDSAELRAETGLTLRPMDALAPMLDTLVDDLPLVVLRDVHSRDYLRADSLTRARAFVDALRQRVPGARIRPGEPLLDSLRIAKSPAEQALLREAAAITVDALREAMRTIEPGMSEAIVEATIEHGYRMQGAQGIGFGSIVGSGPNATSYHYRDNDRVMQQGDVVVMDVGALVHGYTADVTRTVPVDGRFSPEQAAIYRIVLEAQQAAVREIRAGAPLSVGNQAMRRVEAEGLARLGLIESVDATFDPPWATAEQCERGSFACRQSYLYMAHGLGHGIGLEVHDVGGHAYSFSGRFHEGEVLTVEPGIYVSQTLLDMLPDTPRNRRFIEHVRPAVRRYADIGVRIEDDYIVTRDGVDWISPAPRTIEEIEQVMNP